jgi:hypothetical protein
MLHQQVQMERKDCMGLEGLPRLQVKPLVQPVRMEPVQSVMSIELPELP